jgi:hypothetical protein
VFPWKRQADGSYHTGTSSDPPERPSNWSQDGGDWKLTSARARDIPGFLGVNENPQELCGVKGSSVDRAWQVSTGHPTTVIAVLDSGIEWCRKGIVNKLYLNSRALPFPEDAAGVDHGTYDLNGSHVFNVLQYASDPRVTPPNHQFFCGGFISPEDLIQVFGGGSRTGPPGFTEAISGWNFVDNNNDPYDDVHYGHGSGEATDSGGAADSQDGVGTCPNCMIMPVRVGDSFISDGNTFAQAVAFAVDSGAKVVQEALGTIDVTTNARQAVEYANAHGVPIIASAADEEAQHHNLPSALPHTIVVNSITKYPDAGGVPLYNPPSYLYLNGCTNYGANIAVAVESLSCSSEATGKTGGIAGLAESAAADAVAASPAVLQPYPGLSGVDGSPVPLSSNEVQQLVTMSADDVDFLTPVPNYGVVAPVPTTRYPTKPGFDIYTGYGRLNADHVVRAIQAGAIPPEAQLDSPDWFQIFDPAETMHLSGYVAALRTGNRPFSYSIEVGVGPAPDAWTQVASGSGTGRKALQAAIPLSQVAALFPPLTDFSGGGTGPAGRPNPDAFTFSVRLTVTDAEGRAGMDRRAASLHHDPRLLSGFPRHFGGSIDATPTVARFGPGGEDVLLVATADGDVHAFRSNGRELPGWPVSTAGLDYHAASPAFSSGSVGPPRGAILGGLAVADLRQPGRGTDPAVVAGDLGGRVYAWNQAGHLLPGFPQRTRAEFSDSSIRDRYNRLLRGIFGAPALADLEGSGTLDIIAPSMDRHVYAWRPDGTPVPGWPVLAVDTDMVTVGAHDKVTPKDPSKVLQGTKVLDTPAIGKLSRGGGLNVVFGTNEEYKEDPNSSLADPLQALVGQVPLLNAGNSRLYALNANGTRAWQHPAKVADFVEGLLPDVGDGITNSPALADVRGDGNLDIGAISTVGPAYVLDNQGNSIFGKGPDGKDIVLSAEPTGPLSNSPDHPSLPSLGSPILAPLGGPSRVSLVAPATSLQKALDVALPAQQQPNDVQLDAWELSTGHFQAGFPQVMNDLQFFGQPIAANVGGEAAGTFIVEGSALGDLRAINLLGQEAAGFPKFTGGWMVNGPSFGQFGELDHQVLAAGTREGYLFAWSTDTPADASSGPWPRSHHDLCNTGNLEGVCPTFPRLPRKPPPQSSPSASTGSGGGQPGPGGSEGTGSGGSGGSGANAAATSQSSSAATGVSLADSGQPLGGALAGSALLLLGILRAGRRRRIP